MKYFYHATTVDKFTQILIDGKIKTGFDGIIYFAETQQDALKFIALRAFGEPIIVLEIEVPDPNKVEETFDHSYSFFKCRSFGYPESISTDFIVNAYRYE